MLPATEKIRYSFFSKGKHPLTAQTFLEPANFAWAAMIEQNYSVIRDEVLQHYRSNDQQFNPYFANELMNAPGKWRSFGFYFWGVRADDSICKHFKQTIDLLRNIPGIVSASVSVMEQQSEIKPHFGDTNAIYRCHFGLVIPAALPETGFQVGYEQRSWEEGKFLIFNDAAYHKAWNHTNQQRIILIFDVIRPEFIQKTAWICARVNAIIFSQGLMKRKPALQKLLQLKITQWLMSVFIWVRRSRSGLK